MSYRLECKHYLSHFHDGRSGEGCVSRVGSTDSSSGGPAGQPRTSMITYLRWDADVLRTPETPDWEPVPISKIYFK